MSRLETALSRTTPQLARALRRLPWVHNPPLDPDWTKFEMLERDLVLQHASLERGTRVLEVGSGGHALSTVPIALRVGEDGRVAAVERSRWGIFRDVVGMVDLSNRIRPITCDARKLPIRSEAFEAAVCVHGIRSLRSEAIMVGVFREMLRVARRVFLAESLPMARNDAQRAHLAMYDIRQDFFEAAQGGPDDLHYPALETLTRLVTEAGGRVESAEVVEVDLPHALAYLPRDYLLRVNDPGRREELLRRWDRADVLLRAHGADHPPVGTILAIRS